MIPVICLPDGIGTNFEPEMSEVANRQVPYLRCKVAFVKKKDQDGTWHSFVADENRYDIVLYTDLIGPSYVTDAYNIADNTIDLYHAKSDRDIKYGRIIYDRCNLTQYQIDRFALLFKTSAIKTGDEILLKLAADKNVGCVYKIELDDNNKISDLITTEHV